MGGASHTDQGPQDDPMSDQFLVLSAQVALLLMAFPHGCREEENFSQLRVFYA